MMTYGYARVSTADQTTAPQEDALRAAGVEEIVTETISGAVPASRRPVLSALIARLQPGDIVAVARLDRLGRDPADVLTLARDLGLRGVGLRLLDLGVDTQTPAGGLLLAMLAAVAGWERAILIERTNAGLQAAKSRGQALGRRRTLTPAQRDHARELADQGKGVREIGRILGCGASVAHRAINEGTPG